MRRNAAIHEQAVTLTFLGTGDAFGSGGRLQSSIHVDDRRTPFLLDCGATALIAMKRFGIDGTSVQGIFVTHLHGDHTCGIPFILREAQILGTDRGPLSIAGPAGIEEHVHAMMNSLFPGSWGRGFGYDLAFAELEPLRPCTWQDVVVTPFPAVHSPLTRPLSLRVETAGRVIACSGDTEWNPHLVDAAHGADLFVCECFDLLGPRRNHLDYQTLLENHHLLHAGRIVLTHMNATMLEHAGALRFERAHDGMQVTI